MEYVSTCINHHQLSKAVRTMLSASEEVMMCLFCFIVFFSLLCVPTASIAIVPQIFHSGNVSLKHASLFHTRDSFSGSPSPQYAVLFW